MNLSENTILITGGSSGIGFEMAKEFLKRNNKVIITGRNEQKLQEVKEKLDGVVAIRSNVSNPDDIKKLYQQVKKEFPDLNILINNASALFNTEVEKMPVKKYDLVMGINARGTFLASKFAIPHLKKSKNPHILTISPPLGMGDQNVNWFARVGTGYVLAKYGMTLLTHGMAKELEDYRIACNTLWPRTAVATAAVQNLLGGDQTMSGSRTPEIMADAAHVILTSNSEKTTDQFFIDDHVLVSTGVTDFSKYRANPNIRED